MLRSRLDPSWEIGPWRGMRSRYYVVDAAGPHVVLVWSWTFERGPRSLDRNESLMRTVRIR